jgi:hypothetical protein
MVDGVSTGKVTKGRRQIDSLWDLSRDLNVGFGPFSISLDSEEQAQLPIRPLTLPSQT